jgi:hypothetical protein
MNFAVYDLVVLLPQLLWLYQTVCFRKTAQAFTGKLREAFLF